LNYSKIVLNLLAYPLLFVFVFCYLYVMIMYYTRADYITEESVNNLLY